MNNSNNTFKIQEDGISHFTMLHENVFNQFSKAGEIVEVRIIGAYGKSGAWGGENAKGTVSGYFDNFKSFYDSVSIAIKFQQSNIYFTLYGGTDLSNNFF